MNIGFDNPEYLVWALSLSSLYFIISLFNFTINLPRYIFSNLNPINNFKPPLKNKIGKYVSIIIKTVSLFLFISLFARPFILNYSFNDKNKAIDMIIAVDISESMAAEDFKPNRLENAKKIIREYILNRNTDRVGLVVFGKGAYLKSPLTFDYNSLAKYVDDINFEYIPAEYEGDIIYNPAEIHTKTYIASAIGLSAFTLDNTGTKSKTIILLTDGVQTGDENNPIEVSVAVSKKNIKLYTICIGSNNQRAPFPKFYKNKGKIYIKDSSGNDPEIKIDEKLLSEMSRITGGEFFSSRDKDSLKNIFKYINKLEKNEMYTQKKLIKKYIKNYFLILAMLLIIFELILKNTIFKIIKNV